MSIKMLETEGSTYCEVAKYSRRSRKDRKAVLLAGIFARQCNVVAALRNMAIDRLLGSSGLYPPTSFPPLAHDACSDDSIHSSNRETTSFCCPMSRLAASFPWARFDNRTSENCLMTGCFFWPMNWISCQNRRSWRVRGGVARIKSTLISDIDIFARASRTNLCGEREKTRAESGSGSTACPEGHTAQ